MQCRYTADWTSTPPGVKNVTQRTSPGPHVKTSIVAIILAAACALSAAAEQRSTAFTVSVTVPARVVLDVIDQPAFLELTPRDVERGYKDVSARYRVRHNDRNGYLLEFSDVSPVARWIEVRGLDRDVVLRGDPVAIRRSGAAFEQDLSLEFRIVLDPATPPGSVALPLRVAATPLRG
jgi:hypothetical protein